MKPQRGLNPALDLAFLKRCYWALMASVLVIGAFASVYFSAPWAGHYVVAGLWMNVNAVLLARLLWAATSTPRRLAPVLLLLLGKLLWYGCLAVYCLEWRPAPGALVAGALTPPGVFVLKALGWAWVHQRRIPAEASFPTEAGR